MRLNSLCETKKADLGVNSDILNGISDENQEIFVGIIDLIKEYLEDNDKDGKRVKEVKDGKKVTVYDEVEIEIKKDMPSRLHARRQMLKVLYVDETNKLFDEIAPKYANSKHNGGYTRIVKIGQRKGDAALEVLLELV